MRVFHKQLKDKVWEWSIRVDGNDIHVASGFLGGSTEHFFHTENSKYRGKRNEVPASASAMTKAAKMIREKVASGFIEIDPESRKPLLAMQSEQLERWDYLPAGFRTYRKLPLDVNDRYRTEHFRAMVLVDQALIYALPTGRQFTFMINTDRVPKVYSKGGVEFTHSVPHLINELSRAKLPPKTLFTAYVSTGDMSRDRMLFFAKTTQALVDRQIVPGNRLYATVNDVYFWDGQNVISDMTWVRSHEMWRRLWPGIPYFKTINYIGSSFDSAKTWAKMSEDAGVLVYDRFGIPSRDNCYNFHGSGPYGKVWIWRNSMVGEFYMLCHESIGGRTGLRHRSSRSDETRLGKLGLFQLGPDGELLCFGTVRNGIPHDREDEILEEARRYSGWVGKARVRYRGYHEPMHSNVVSRLIDPYFLGFEPNDASLQCLRDSGVVPDLGTPRDRERRGASALSNPTGPDPIQSSEA